MRRGLITAGMCALALAPAATASAAAVPVPGCNGLHATDRRGDVETPGLDVIAMWADHSAGETSIAVRIADLEREVTPRYTFRAYDLVYTIGNETTSMRASIDAAGQIAFWRWDTNGVVADRATGQMFLGPDGVVRFVLDGVKPGDVITTYAVATRDFAGAPPVGGTVDEAESLSTPFIRYTVGTCPPPPVAAPPAAVAPAAVDPVPPARPATATALPVEVGRTTRRGRAIVVRVAASAPVEDLRAELLGPRGVVATGKLASLTRAGVLRLASGRRVAAGRYRLHLTGVSGEARLARTYAVRIRR